MTKLKAFADDNCNIAQTTEFEFDRVENIMGKGEMLVTSIFSCPTMFSKDFRRVSKSWDCVVNG